MEPCLRESNGEPLVSPWYIGSECDGGFADYVSVAARHAYPIETTLSDAELASFPCSYSSRKHADPRAGHRKRLVAYYGRFGWRRLSRYRAARARGARVIAVAGHKKRQSVLDAGADQALVGATA